MGYINLLEGYNCEQYRRKQVLGDPLAGFRATVR